MKILLLGGGGREHAIAKALSESNETVKIFCSPGNPGIFQLAEKADLDIKNHSLVANFCRENSIDFVVVGPEQPLADGLADSLADAGIKTFGPKKNAAKIESSKDYAKNFMAKHNIPTAKFKSFTKETSKEAREYIDSLEKFPIVIKADGLAAGKGVIIAVSREEARIVLDSMFAGKFGEASEKVVIEEFLEGEEASVLAITDGKDYVTLAPSQDHKRALDGDKGLNTGGMGAYAPAPIVDKEMARKVESEIIQPTIEGMTKDGVSFVGCIYAGLMISNGEPKVLEFNVRFGDPEAQAVLSGFKGDFAKLLHSAASGKIDKSVVENVAAVHSCCVVLASEGYPGSYEKGKEITGIEEAEKTGAIVYQAGTKLQDGKLTTSGGRVLGVTGRGDNLKNAINNAYEAAYKIKFDNRYFRKDIGAKGLERL